MHRFLMCDETGSQVLDQFACAVVRQGWVRLWYSWKIKETTWGSAPSATEYLLHWALLKKAITALISSHDKSSKSK